MFKNTSHYLSRLWLIIGCFSLMASSVTANTLQLPLPQVKGSQVISASSNHSKALNNLDDLSALNTKPLWTHHLITIKPNGSLSLALDRLQVNKQAAFQIQHLKNGHYLTQLNAGDKLEIWLNNRNELQRIVYPKSKQLTFELTKNQNSFIIKPIHKKIETRIIVTGGTIEDSFYLSGERTGLSPKSIMNLAHIFTWEIDFIRQLRAGDAFKVIYEKKYIDGQYIGDGNILAAEITTEHHNVHDAFLLKDAKGKTLGYFDRKGHSLKKAFLRNPVDYVRITSRYSSRRYHPVKKKWKAHHGVDYGGKIGTPIHVTGNGRIIKRYRSKSYGNVIFVKHPGPYITVYAHMSRFARNHVGSYVKQGQIIGYIGQTGWATGPHLHYEFRIHNRFHDPLKVKFPDARPVPKKYRATFKKTEHLLQAQLDRISSKSLLVLREFE